MTFFIQPPVAAAFKLCPFPGWDHRLSTLAIDTVYQGIAVIALVREYTAAFQLYMFQEWYGHSDVITLSLAEEQVYGVSVRVYGCVDLRTGTAAAVPLSHWEAPFFSTCAVLMCLYNRSIYR